MPKYVYYDRRSWSAESMKQYFHESRTKAADKELQTNMPKDLQFDRDFKIQRILVTIPIGLRSSTTALDATLDDVLFEFINNGVIELQVGGGEVHYYPVALALGGPNILEMLQYTLATAADRTFTSINAIGKEGLEVDITVPANTDLKFIIKTKSPVTISDVKVYLIGERA